MDRVSDALPLQSHTLDAKIITGLQFKGQHLRGENDPIIRQLVETDRGSCIRRRFYPHDLRLTGIELKTIPPHQAVFGRRFHGNSLSRHARTSHLLRAIVQRRCLQIA